MHSLLMFPLKYVSPKKKKKKKKKYSETDKTHFIYSYMESEVWVSSLK